MKLTLNDLVNLQNETTAVNTINSNNVAIENIVEDTLSRSGLSPNTMGNVLDMNSNQIINLPQPLSANSAARLQDLATLKGGGTVSSIPSGGTTDQLLVKNSNTSYDVKWTSGRTRLANPTNLYVTTTGNDSNSGSISAPFLTLQQAVNIALSTYDFQGLNLIINVGAGIFAGATIGGPNPGGGGAAQLVILGSGSANTTINTTINVRDGASVAIGSFKITVGSGSNILVQNGSLARLYDGGMNFGSAVTSLIDVVNTSQFQGSGTFGFTISGGAGSAFLISTNSNVQLSAGGTYTLTGTPAFPNGFVNAINGSGFNPGITSVFSGSATGPTYNLAINSWVDMEQNLNPLPGNSGGLLTYGSSYYGSPAANAIGVGASLLSTTSGIAFVPGATGTFPSWSAGTLSGTASETITNSTAPASPASGKVTIWTDSTDLRFHDKNSAGNVGTTIVADGTITPNSFIQSISTAGQITKSTAVSSVIGGNQTITTTGTIQTDSGLGIQNLSLAASVGSNILTVALKDSSGADCSATSSARIQFRNSTLTTGSVSSNYVTTALSVSTNAVGASLGTVNATAFRFWVCAFDNAGTTVLALFNAADATHVYPLNTAALASTTPMSAAATSAGVFYTPNGTTLTSKCFRILGYVEYSAGLATAGTYASGPTLIQLYGPGIRKPGDIVQSTLVVGGSVSRAGSITYADVSNTAMTLTPTSAANAVLVTYSGGAQATAGGAGVNTEITAQIAVGGTVHSSSSQNTIGVVSAAGSNQQTDGALNLSLWHYPNATSTQTYTVQTKALNTSGNANVSSVNGMAQEIMR